MGDCDNTASASTAAAASSVATQSVAASVAAVPVAPTVPASSSPRIRRSRPIVSRPVVHPVEWNDSVSLDENDSLFHDLTHSGSWGGEAGSRSHPRRVRVRTPPTPPGAQSLREFSMVAMMAQHEQMLAETKHNGHAMPHVHIPTLPLLFSSLTATNDDNTALLTSSARSFRPIPPPSSRSRASTSGHHSASSRSVSIASSDAPSISGTSSSVSSSSARQPSSSRSSSSSTGSGSSDSSHSHSSSTSSTDGATPRARLNMSVPVPSLTPSAIRAGARRALQQRNGTGATTLAESSPIASSSIPEPTAHSESMQQHSASPAQPVFMSSHTTLARPTPRRPAVAKPAAGLRHTSTVSTSSSFIPSTVPNAAASLLHDADVDHGAEDFSSMAFSALTDEALDALTEEQLHAMKQLSSYARHTATFERVPIPRPIPVRSQTHRPRQPRPSSPVHSSRQTTAPNKATHDTKRARRSKERTVRSPPSTPAAASSSTLPNHPAAAAWTPPSFSPMPLTDLLRRVANETFFAPHGNGEQLIDFLCHSMTDIGGATLTHPQKICGKHVDHHRAQRTPLQILDGLCGLEAHEPHRRWANLNEVVQEIRTIMITPITIAPMAIASIPHSFQSAIETWYDQFGCQVHRHGSRRKKRAPRREVDADTSPPDESSSPKLKAPFSSTSSPHTLYQLTGGSTPLALSLLRSVTSSQPCTDLKTEQGSTQTLVTACGRKMLELVLKLLVVRAALIPSLHKEHGSSDSDHDHAHCQNRISSVDREKSASESSPSSQPDAAGATTQPSVAGLSAQHPLHHGELHIARAWLEKGHRALCADDGSGSMASDSSNTSNENHNSALGWLLVGVELFEVLHELFLQHATFDEERSLLELIRDMEISSGGHLTNEPKRNGQTDQSEQSNVSVEQGNIAVVRRSSGNIHDESVDDVYLIHPHLHTDRSGFSHQPTTPDLSSPHRSPAARNISGSMYALREWMSSDGCSLLPRAMLDGLSTRNSSSRTNTVSRSDGSPQCHLHTKASSDRALSKLVTLICDGHAQLALSYLKDTQRLWQEICEEQAQIVAMTMVDTSNSEVAMVDVDDLASQTGRSRTPHQISLAPDRSCFRNWRQLLSYMQRLRHRENEIRSTLLDPVCGLLDVSDSNEASSRKRKQGDGRADLAIQPIDLVPIVMLGAEHLFPPHAFDCPLMTDADRDRTQVETTQTQVQEDVHRFIDDEEEADAEVEAEADAGADMDGECNTARSLPHSSHPQRPPRSTFRNPNPTLKLLATLSAAAKAEAGSGSAGYGQRFKSLADLIQQLEIMNTRRRRAVVADIIQLQRYLSDTTSSLSSSFGSMHHVTQSRLVPRAPNMRCGEDVWQLRHMLSSCADDFNILKWRLTKINRTAQDGLVAGCDSMSSSLFPSLNDLRHALTIEASKAANLQKQILHWLRSDACPLLNETPSTSTSPTPRKPGATISNQVKSKSKTQSSSTRFPTHATPAFVRTLCAILSNGRSTVNVTSSASSPNTQFDIRTCQTFDALANECLGTDVDCDPSGQIDVSMKPVVAFLRQLVMDGSILQAIDWQQARNMMNDAMGSASDLSSCEMPPSLSPSSSSFSSPYIHLLVLAHIHAHESLDRRSKILEGRRQWILECLERLREEMSNKWELFMPLSDHASQVAHMLVDAQACDEGTNEGQQQMVPSPVAIQKRTVQSIQDLPLYFFVSFLRACGCLPLTQATPTSTSSGGSHRFEIDQPTDASGAVDLQSSQLQPPPHSEMDTRRAVTTIVVSPRNGRQRRNTHVTSTPRNNNNTTSKLGTTSHSSSAAAFLPPWIMDTSHSVAHGTDDTNVMATPSWHSHSLDQVLLMLNELWHDRLVTAASAESTSTSANSAASFPVDQLFASSFSNELKQRRADEMSLDHTMDHGCGDILVGIGSPLSPAAVRLAEAIRHGLDRLVVERRRIIDWIMNDCDENAVSSLLDLDPELIGNFRTQVKSVKLAHGKQNDKDSICEQEIGRFILRARSGRHTSRIIRQLQLMQDIQLQQEQQQLQQRASHDGAHVDVDHPAPFSTLDALADDVRKHWNEWIVPRGPIILSQLRHVLEQDDDNDDADDDDGNHETERGDEMRYSNDVRRSGWSDPPDDGSDDDNDHAMRDAVPAPDHDHAVHPSHNRHKLLSMFELEQLLDVFVLDRMEAYVRNGNLPIMQRWVWKVDEDRSKPKDVLHAQPSSASAPRSSILSIFTQLYTHFFHVLLDLLRLAAEEVSGAGGPVSSLSRMSLDQLLETLRTFIRTQREEMVTFLAGGHDDEYDMERDGIGREGATQAAPLLTADARAHLRQVYDMDGGDELDSQDQKLPSLSHELDLVLYVEGGSGGQVFLARRSLESLVALTCNHRSMEQALRDAGAALCCKRTPTDKKGILSSNDDGENGAEMLTEQGDTSDVECNQPDVFTSSLPPFPLVPCTSLHELLVQLCSLRHAQANLVRDVYALVSDRFPRGTLLHSSCVFELDGKRLHEGSSPNTVEDDEDEEEEGASSTAHACSFTLQDARTLLQLVEDFVPPSIQRRVIHQLLCTLLANAHHEQSCQLTPDQGLENVNQGTGAHDIMQSHQQHRPPFTSSVALLSACSHLVSGEMQRLRNLLQRIRNACLMVDDDHHASDTDPPSPSPSDKVTNRLTPASDLIASHPTLVRRIFSVDFFHLLRNQNQDGMDFHDQMGGMDRRRVGGMASTMEQMLMEDGMGENESDGEIDDDMLMTNAFRNEEGEDDADDIPSVFLQRLWLCGGGSASFIEQCIQRHLTYLYQMELQDEAKQPNKPRRGEHSAAVKASNVHSARSGKHKHKQASSTSKLSQSQSQSQTARSNSNATTATTTTTTPSRRHVPRLLPNPTNVERRMATKQKKKEVEKRKADKETSQTPRSQQTNAQAAKPSKQGASGKKKKKNKRKKQLNEASAIDHDESPAPLDDNTAKASDETLAATLPMVTVRGTGSNLGTDAQSVQDIPSSSSSSSSRSVVDSRSDLLRLMASWDNDALKHERRMMELLVERKLIPPPSGRRRRSASTMPTQRAMVPAPSVSTALHRASLPTSANTSSATEPTKSTLEDDSYLDVDRPALQQLRWWCDDVCIRQAPSSSTKQRKRAERQPIPVVPLRHSIKLVGFDPQACADLLCQALCNTPTMSIPSSSSHPATACNASQPHPSAVGFAHDVDFPSLSALLSAVRSGLIEHRASR